MTDKGTPIFHSVSSGQSSDVNKHCENGPTDVDEGIFAKLSLQGTEPNVAAPLSTEHDQNLSVERSPNLKPPTNVSAIHGGRELALGRREYSVNSQSDERLEVSPQNPASLTPTNSRQVDSGAMRNVDAPPFECNTVTLWNACPWNEKVTDYDKRNVYLYANLLDADREGATSRDMAKCIFRINFDRHPDWALEVVRTHLGRARWIKANHFPFLDW